ncbi:ubiquinol-cytochrome C reductase [Aureimonas sp. Leaf454]|uniref:EVE domain-containing protein n=1 Tax=Aureimonas sp. Leaf454 TaxID=1736381 RepID=UPI0006F6F18C|nr:EVE domain-containing protein [Aureimonas sp. Leaf454]KQT52672.1 ubiquinol-cytochrome C reductase [Aureimonas sp. Leaf454]
MAFWLFKSEPVTWSWDQQVEAGRDGTAWTGVRNYQARNFMRAMEPGERGFFYHSNEGKAVVGIVEVASPAHPDDTAEKPGIWDCVDLRAVMPLARPVPLDVIKGDPRLSDMVLATNSRLSVQPVREAEFRTICEMGGLDPDDALS